MNCTESERLLHQRLDGEAVDCPLLEQHLRDCAACLEQHRAGQLLREATRAIPRPVPAATLSGRIALAVLADRRQRRLRSFAMGFAVAASVLIALGIYITLPTPDAVPVVERPVKPAEPTRNAEGPKAPSLNERVAEVGVAVTSLSGRLADTTLAQAEILWQATAPVDLSVVSISAAENMADPIGPATEPLRRAGQGVSQGIDTVTASARRAVDYFFRELGGVN